ncbi:hypothetical protein [Actinomadura rudentiformis]|uniref:Uncharacterized protein n=1 Tax=Actinomadura rudentiformis TaxID=359158 RepID=A0A6H9YZ43_9ACTN|nr:hypothetical protein [Actinomadura rudentiformis]KAB2347303.1 hypothetical protein F8566_20025 [Actinomadura rudentiformis]
MTKTNFARSDRDELRHLRELQQAALEACDADALSTLIGQVATGSADQAEVEKLRAAVGDLLLRVKSLHEDNTRLRDQAYRDTVTNREYCRSVEEAAQRRARDRAQDFAVRALQDLVHPVRQLAERYPSAQADRVLSKLEREIDPESPRAVLADMQAAHRRLMAEKRALWNTLFRHGLLNDLDPVRPENRQDEAPAAKPARMWPLRDDSAKHQIRLITPANSHDIAVTCTCMPAGTWLDAAPILPAERAIAAYREHVNAREPAKEVERDA